MIVLDLKPPRSIPITHLYRFPRTLISFTSRRLTRKPRWYWI